MIRLAIEKDFDALNILRKEVNDLHVAGEPKIFKGFTAPMQEYLRGYLGANPAKLALVYEENSEIVGFAMLEFVNKPESAHAYSSIFLKVEEIGVSKNFQGRGIGNALIEKAKIIAREKGVLEIQLDVWAFNKSALKFYKNAGFENYREYLRLKI